MCPLGGLVDTVISVVSLYSGPAFAGCVLLPRYRPKTNHRINLWLCLLIFLLDSHKGA